MTLSVTPRRRKLRALRVGIPPTTPPRDPEGYGEPPSEGGDGLFSFSHRTIVDLPLYTYAVSVSLLDLDVIGIARPSYVRFKTDLQWSDCVNELQPARVSRCEVIYSGIMTSSTAHSHKRLYYPNVTSWRLGVLEHIDNFTEAWTDTRGNTV